jgi:hypothetical protein
MRFAQRATMLIAVAITGPALAAPTIAAAAAASSTPAMARRGQWLCQGDRHHRRGQRTGRGRGGPEDQYRLRGQRRQRHSVVLSACPR